MCPPTAPPGDHAPDDVVELEFELTDPSYFFVGLSAEQSCAVRLEEMIGLADGSLVEFFTARDSSVGAIRELADRTDLIDSVRVFYETNREVLFQLTIPGQCIARTVEESGAVPQSVAATDGTGRVIALVPKGVASRNVVESIAERHPTSELGTWSSRSPSGIRRRNSSHTGVATYRSPGSRRAGSGSWPGVDSRSASGKCSERPIGGGTGSDPGSRPGRRSLRNSVSPAPRSHSTSGRHTGTSSASCSTTGPGQSE